MKAGERREEIIARLRGSDKPFSASRLAADLQVSRQIIVGDIALLRAQGHSIYASPRGYIYQQDSLSDHIRTIACKHAADLTQTELNICVDNGCKVRNVIVDHPLYGQLTGELQLASRFDVGQFMDLFEKHKAHSLCELTNDIHLHTLECPDEESYQRVCRELDRLGILIYNEEKKETTLSN